jgi:hypothetical protein
MGIDTTKSHRITEKTNRNISCVKRLLAKDSIIRTPLWASEDNRTYIIPLALVSEINIARDSDKEIVAKLSGTSFGEYISRLDEWLDKEDTPVYKYGDIYRINSKEEALRVLKPSYKSPKLLELENVTKEIFGVRDPLFEKSVDKWYIRDVEYKYSRRMIEGILDTFAILSGDEGAQPHYDNFVKRLLNGIKTDEALLRTFVKQLPLISEISADAVLEYIADSIDSDDQVFRALAEISYGSLIGKSSDLLYPFWAVECCLVREECAVKAFEVLIKMYLKDYKSSSKEQIDNDIASFVAPIISCIIAIKPIDKQKIVLQNVKNISADKIDLVAKLFFAMRYHGDKVFMPVITTEWKPYKEYNGTYYPDEFMEVDKTATDWLFENYRNKSKLISEVLSYDLVNYYDEYIDDIFAKIDNKIIKDLQENEKPDINSVLTQCLKNFTFYIDNRDDENETVKAQKIADKIRKAIESTLAKNLFERYRWYFEKEKFRDYDYDDDDWDEEQIKSELKLCKIIDELIEEYGNGILDKLIDITDNAHHVAWRAICAKSKNIMTDIGKLTRQKKAVALSIYLGNINPLTKEVKKMIAGVTDEGFKNIICLNLPLRQDCFEFVKREKLEEYFWCGRQINEKDMTDEYFSKLLEYYPQSLLITYYPVGGKLQIPYEKAMMILNAIIQKGINKKVFSMSGPGALFYRGGQYDFDDLKAFIDALDKQYYTDENLNEIAKCEFELLHYYMSTANGECAYPYGLTEFFWNNPIECFNLFYDLYTNDNMKDVSENTVAKRLSHNSQMQFGDTCIIPVKYIMARPQEFTNWINTILSKAKGTKEEKVFHKFENFMINIMALCPEIRDQKVWPIREVADLLESFKDFYSTEYMRHLQGTHNQRVTDENRRKIKIDEILASKFYGAKFNSHSGARVIGDGTLETAEYERYIGYSKCYEITHPITALALKFLAESFKQDAENDKRQAILGWDY